MRKNKSNRVICKFAIDPGWSGGIVVGYTNGDIVVHKMPSTMPDVMDFFYDLGPFDDQVKCHMEKISGGMPGNAAHNSWKFCQNVSTCRCALYAEQISVTETTPQKWMKALGIKPGMEKNARKNRIKELMQVKYPHIKVVLWNSDALALYSLFEEFVK